MRPSRPAHASREVRQWRSPADLAAGPADVGVSTGWVPTAVDARTYRITVDVLSGTAPGQTSTATFRWLVVPGPAPEPSSPSPQPSSPAPEPTSPAPESSSPTPEPAAPTAQPTRTPTPTRTSPAPKPT